MASVYTVTQVTSYIKNMFTQDFALNRISIKGEVSNCKYHTSGHIYFTLKDGGAQIAAVMFAGQRKGLAFRLEEGQEVTVSGAVDVYERDGRYQLYAKEITREGRGDLFARFEKLRNELEEMGMFDPGYKQPVPPYARKVGIVTAATGAAIQDIMNISARRNPYVQLILYPALVQGEQARFSIVRGIETLDAMGLDIMIVGRGGGAIEDLWAFNEEMVARAIFNCSTPVISAVGHETDVTIADYVADMRAPTPSAAAELAVFDYSQFEARIDHYRQLLNRSVKRMAQQQHFRLEQCRMKLALFNPERQINDKRQRLADIENFLENRLSAQILEARTRLAQRRVMLERQMELKMKDSRHRLSLMAGRLEGTSPLNKLSGGYGYITDSAGKGIKTVEQAGPGDMIEVQVRDGRMKAQVREVERLKMKPPANRNAQLTERNFLTGSRPGNRK